MDAIVLAGGAARRLDGADKPGLVVGRDTLLDRVISAVIPARVIVVGPERSTRHAVTWVREDPPGGGPAVAAAAALPQVTAPLVALLAADLPFLDAATIARLVAAAQGRDGALLVDEHGRDQLLVGVWRTAALRSTLTGSLAGRPLGPLLAQLDAERVASTGSDCPPWFDCDTEHDVELARKRAAAPRASG